MQSHITKSSFIDTFKSSNTYKDNFTYTALDALFEYYEELEDAIGEKIQFDMVAICCDWCEDKLESILTNYGLDTLEELEENTTMIQLENGNILYITF